MAKRNKNAMIQRTHAQKQVQDFVVSNELMDVDGIVFAFAAV